MDLKDRYLGTLVGVHVGDSLGAPYETWTSKRIAEDIKERGGLTLFDYENPWKTDGNGDTLPAGRPTDDSDQTAVLADHLIRYRGIDPEKLRLDLRKNVVEGISLLWNGRATGAGGTTRKALSDNPEEVKEALANTIGTNGSLMRAAPMGLWFGSNTTLRVGSGWRKYDQVRLMSEVTHAHPHAICACLLYTDVLMITLEGNGEYFFSGFLGERLKNRLFDPHDFPYDPGAWPARGTAEFSLYVALYALLKTKSFAEGIELAIRIGGDTDTYAAIAGGLLGAKYGYEGIPQKWREGILGHDTMVKLAKKLYNLRFSNVRS